MSERQSLREFVETHNLPTRVKVTEGFYNTDHVDWEFSSGDVLDLQRLTCPSVTLSFFHPDTGEETKLSVTTKSLCFFKILPYIPEWPIDKPLIVKTVFELIRVWPPAVCTIKPYADHRSNLSLQKGERIRLKRVVRKDSVDYLECKSEAQMGLLQLPMDCDAGFRLIEDSTAFTLEEIVGMPARVKRRIRLTEDNVNKTSQIAGLPQDFSGDLFMLPPHRYVEIHPAGSPGEEFVVPLNLDITVEDRDDDYLGASWAWYPLNDFVEANIKKFPMVVQLCDWQEEPSSLQAIRASVGDRVVLHYGDTIKKVACQSGDSYFSIPLTYTGVGIIKPRTFIGIEDVYKCRAKKVKVIRSASSEDMSLSGVKKGEILEISNIRIRPDLSHGRLINETEVICVRKNGAPTIYELPLYLGGQYDELKDISRNISERFTLGHLTPEMLPITINFFDPPTDFAPSKDPLPKQKDITLHYIYDEPCVVTSKDAKRVFSCPVPLRAKIHVRFISPYPANKLVPVLSPLTSCPEMISEEVFEEMESTILYLPPVDHLVEPPTVPERGVPEARDDRSRTFPLTGRSGPLPEVPDDEQSQGAVGGHPVSLQRSRSDPPPKIPPRASKKANTRGGVTGFFKKTFQGKPAKQPGRVPPPPPPLRGHTDTKETHKEAAVKQDDVEYEDIADLTDYTYVLRIIFGESDPPVITIPSHANLQAFSWEEMVVFLQLHAMPARSLQLFAERKITGRIFSRMTDSELNTYGINYPLVRHFRNKSRN